MNRSRSLFALLPVALWLTGCSGSSAPTNSGTPSTQTFGPLTTRIVGAAQSPVTSSATNGANVTGIAGALIDQLTLNSSGTPTLADTKIAFTSTRDGNNEVYVMNADGTNPLRLTNNAATDYASVWSPDGTKLAFVSTRDGNTEVYVMNADGTGQTRLTNNAAVDYEPSWSPDGTRIAFTTSRDAGNYEIYAMNADGTNQTRITNNAAVDQTSSWSPSGGRIAFSSNRDGNYEVYTMNADGTSQTRLTNNASSDIAPSWSPDGTKIAFSSFRDANYEVYSVNAFGGSETNLSRLPSIADEQPAWSGYLARTPKNLVGVGGTLGTVAAGFLYAQNGASVSSVVAFDTSTVGSRAGARVTSQSAPFNDQGRNLIFSITTTAGLASVRYVNLNEAGVPGATVAPTIPVGSTGALVSFVATDGTVNSVLPYAANRSAGLKPMRAGDTVTYAGSFTAVFDASGKNLAPSGAKSVTLDEKTGKLVRFE